MHDSIELFDSLAALLVYPQKDYQQNVEACAQRFPSDNAKARQHYGLFVAGIKDRSLSDLEELFTTTFDLNPVCSLEVGWHLYGENYSRGEFLVWMRQQLRHFALQETCELPDHLVHVLPVLGRMNERQAQELAGQYVTVALDKMLAAMAGKENPYENLLKAIRSLLPVAGFARIQQPYPVRKNLTPDERASRARMPLAMIPQAHEDYDECSY